MAYVLSCELADFFCYATIFIVSNPVFVSNLLFMNSILRLSFAFFLLLVFSLPIEAQISQGGEPHSFQYKQEMLSELHFEQMPFVDVPALRAEDAQIDPLRDRPWRFGKNISVSFNPQNSGVWDELPGGDRIWRLAIESTGAKSLNFLFDSYKLPEGAELFIYSFDKQHILGAFSAFNNREDGVFATTLIMTDRVVIEYYEPAYTEFRADLNLTRVTHGYRGVADYTKDFGESGYCNVNVACPESAGMEDQIRSVAMLVSGGNGFCTGALINNTAEDATPYFLSADHCYSSPSSVVYWFNWQSETCSNPSSSPSYNSISGASDRASNSASDFWLVELSSAPPESFSPYYAGWNRTTASALNEKIWCIHHPSGDIKKISWADNGVTTSDYLGSTGSGSSHWRVGSWSDGTTTEPGSSGSPLFDSQGRIIGQLHGGYAACGNTDPDWYGKLSVSWIGGGSSSTRLSDWLDPSNTGETAINGYGPFDVSYANDAQLNTIVAPESQYLTEQSISPQVIIKNNGTNTMSSAAVSYTIDGNPGEILNWTGNLSQNQTEAIVFSDIFLEAGEYEFEATVIMPGDENPANNSLALTVSVFDCGSGQELPYEEGFEAAQIPACWEQEYIIGSIDWNYAAGNGGSNPSSAYDGSSNAYFKVVSSSDRGKISRLISSKLNLADYSDVQLNFYLHNEEWYGDQDILKIYYKNSESGSWNILETYDSNISQWTGMSVNLQDAVLSDNFYLAFEAEAQWGYGVCIDDIVLSGTPTAVKQIPSGFVKLYPNPVREMLWLEFGDDSQAIDISLKSLTGQILFQTHIPDSNKAGLDLTDYANGIYLLQITKNGDVQSFKIVKQF